MLRISFLFLVKKWIGQVLAWWKLPVGPSPAWNEEETDPAWREGVASELRPIALSELHQGVQYISVYFDEEYQTLYQREFLVTGKPRYSMESYTKGLLVIPIFRTTDLLHEIAYVESLGLSDPADGFARTFLGTNDAHRILSRIVGQNDVEGYLAVIEPFLSEMEDARSRTIVNPEITFHKFEHR